MIDILFMGDRRQCHLEDKRDEDVSEQIATARGEMARAIEGDARSRSRCVVCVVDGKVDGAKGESSADLAFEVAFWNAADALFTLLLPTSPKPSCPTLGSCV